MLFLNLLMTEFLSLLTSTALSRELMLLNKSQIQRKNNDLITLELIIKNNMISNQLIKNMNAHRKLLSRIVKIDKNLEFISDSNDVINSLSYEDRKSTRLNSSHT